MSSHFGELINSPLVVSLLNEAGRLGVPTKAEERYLIIMAQKGCRESRDELSVRHSPFVVSEVKKMGGWGLEYQDLFQEAMVGLDTAITKFDVEAYSNRFISYAVWWIRQAMLIAAQNTGGTIRVPANRHAVLIETRRLRAEGLISSHHDVADRFGLKEPIARAVFDAASSIISLNAQTNQSGVDGDEAEVGDFVPAPFCDDVADGDEFSWAMRLVYGHKKLSEREKHIVIQRSMHGRSLDDIGREMGVSRERIRQLENRAMRRLRHAAKEYDRLCGFSREDRRSMLNMGA